MRFESALQDCVNQPIARAGDRHMAWRGTCGTYRYVVSVALEWGIHRSRNLERHLTGAPRNMLVELLLCF